MLEQLKAQLEKLQQEIQLRQELNEQDKAVLAKLSQDLNVHTQEQSPMQILQNMGI